MKTLKIFPPTILLILATLPLIFGGCSHTTPSPGPPSSYKVKTITISRDIYHDTLTFVYDGLGRVLTVRPTTQAGYDLTYTYNGNDVGIDAYNFAFSSIHDCIGKLDAQGLLSTASLSESSPDNISSIYHYDANGFMLTENVTTVQYGRTSTYMKHSNWIDSNLISLVMDTSIIATYSYYNRREYRDNGLQEISVALRNIALSNQVLILGSIYGKNNKNLIKTRYAGNQTTTFTYDFDIYGRVVNQIEVSGTDSTKSTYTYY